LEAEKTLAILGASRLYSGYIDAARRMGFRVLVFDRNQNAFGARKADMFEHVDITDKDGVLKCCKQRRISGILAVNDYGVETQSHVAQAMGLSGLPSEIAANCVNKEIMRLLWQKAGLPTPFFRKAITFEDVSLAAKQGPGYPYVLKPVNSRGGGQRGVSIAYSGKDLQYAFSFAQEAYPDVEVLIEEYLIGSEHTLEAFVWKGHVHVLAMSDRIKVNEVFRVDKTIVYPTSLPSDKIEKASEMAAKLILAIGIENGPVHLEFCCTEQGVIPFELGARGGGGVISTHIVPYVTGVDFPGAMIRWVTGSDPGNLKSSRQYSAVLNFITPEPGILVSCEGLEEVMEESLDADFYLHPKDMIPEVRTGPDRSGYIVTGAANREDAMRKAVTLESRLRIIVEPANKSQMEIYEKE